MFFQNNAVYELALSKTKWVSKQTLFLIFLWDTFAVGNKHWSQQETMLSITHYTAFKLVGKSVACKTLTPAPATDFFSALVLPFRLSYHLITTEQVSVFVMKPQLMTHLGLPSVFHNTIHYITLFCLNCMIFNNFSKGFFKLWLFQKKISVFSTASLLISQLLPSHYSTVLWVLAVTPSL